LQQFKELFDAYKNMVYNLCLHYVQNIEDAEELTQDTFVSVYANLDGFKNESTLKTWIYRIAINKCLDFLKSKQRKQKWMQLLSIFGYEQSFVNLSHPGAELENKESIQSLLNLINELPDNQKTVIILSKIEQHSQIQIAEIMEISVKAVESLVYRAKNNLQKKMENTKD
jgi:RNA polymerase sigma-70 factor (ECF subfamily)